MDRAEEEEEEEGDGKFFIRCSQFCIKVRMLFIFRDVYRPCSDCTNINRSSNI